MALGWGSRSERSPASRRSVSNNEVEHGTAAYPVPVGMADYVRVYGPGQDNPLPSLSGVALSPEPAGLSVTAVHPWAPEAAQGLQPGDVIVAVDGAPPGSVAALRLAYERLDRDTSLLLTLRREAGDLSLRLPHPRATVGPGD